MKVVRGKTDMVGRVEEGLKRIGAIRPTKDASGLKKAFALPVDITRVASPELGKLMAQCVEYSSYLLSEIALAEVRALESKRYYFRHKAEMTKFSEDESIKWKIEAKMERNKELQSLQNEMDYEESLVSNLKAIQQGLQDKYAVLSREISRRVMDSEVHRS